MKKYKVNEIFKSVQAEGYNAGRSAVFVRFSGCNLSCPFCDTTHESYVEMSKEDINNHIKNLSEDKENTIVVFTGGEPLLQLSDEEELGHGYKRTIESNGILNLPKWWSKDDWFTISPKTKLPIEKLNSANELKFIYSIFEDSYLDYIKSNTNKPLLYLQPLESNNKYNIEDTINYINKNPEWRLSVQWHKIMGVR